ncbi:MAG TPA: hypothetical protein PLU53_13850, partial [Bacteroidia bacterium]|nr:hypothetical protein [Bacteroidia bacterium]
MKTKLRFTLAFLCILISTGSRAQSVQLDWEARDGGPGYSGDLSASVTHDNQGNTYITGKVTESGSFDGESTVFGIMTVKLDASGSIVWKKYYFNPSNNNCYPVGIAFDGNSAIYVAGNQQTSVYEYQVVIRKYDLNGAILWTQIYDDALTGPDLVNAMALGTNGAVYLACTSTEFSGSSTFFRTVKYDNSGTFQWQRDFDLGNAGWNEALVITTDALDNCYTAGTCKNAPGAAYYNVSVVSYTASGTYNWSGYQYSQSFDAPLGIIRSASANTYIVARMNSAATVLRYNSAGLPDWNMSTPDIDANLLAHDIAVDANDNTYITGGKYYTGANDMVTVKFDAAGTPTPFVYAGSNDDVGISVECDAAGNIYALGYTAISITGQPFHVDYYLINYNTAGVEQWHNQIARQVSYETSSYYGYGPYLILINANTIAIAGYDYSPVADEDFQCSHVSGSGSLLWTKLINRSGHGYDFCKSAAMDAARSIYVTGASEGLDGFSHAYTVKYDKDGQKLWDDRIYTAYEDHRNVMLAIDNNGNTFVTFYLYRTNWFHVSPLRQVGVVAEMVTAKYDPNGTRLWVHYSATDATPADIKIDANGNFYVLATYNNSPGSDIALYKFDTDGMPLWSKIYSWSDNDVAASLAIDGTGKAYAGFTATDNLGYSDAIVVTWDAAGNQDWSSSYLGNGGSPQAIKIMVDANQNAFYFVTSVNASTKTDLCVQKFDASGSYRLEVRYDGPSHDDDFGEDMTIDDNGYAYITGCAFDPMVYEDFVVAKLNMNGLSGAVEWSNVFNGTGDDYDSGTRIALDWNGNVYVSGKTTASLGNADMLTFKFDATGTELWRSTFNGPSTGNQIAYGGVFTEGKGEVYVSGYGYSSDTASTDFITYKYCEVPVVTVSGNTTFCAGGSVILSTDSAYSYNWSNGATTRSVSIAAGGNYSVTTNNCASSTPVTVTVNPLPSVSISPAGTVAICQGESINLNASGGITYLWSPGGQTTSSIQTSAAGTFSVAVTDNNGCSNVSLPTTVIVNPLPVVTITPNNPAPLCDGDT